MRRRDRRVRRAIAGRRENRERGRRGAGIAHGIFRREPAPDLVISAFTRVFDALWVDFRFAVENALTPMGLLPGGLGSVLGPVFCPLLRSPRTDRHCFRRAGHAPAAGGFDEGIEVVAAVVVGDLVARLDVFDRADLDHVLGEIDFRVRPARMVDIARAVLAAGAVDRPARIDLEQIPRIERVGGIGVNLPAGVADDELALPDRDAGEKTQSSFGSTDSEVARR
jgi:hypothetical protein